MSNFENDIINSLKTLRAGGIILYPTDTIWGIGCEATNENAVKRIYDLKKREEKKSMIVLMDDVGMVNQYVSNPSQNILSYISLSEKPTTAIFKDAACLPKNMINEDGSIAIRIAKNDFCQQLIQRLQKPLVSTSANISGEMPPQNFTEVSDQIKNGVDYIVQHRQNDFSKNSPSAIVKINENGEIEFIRK